jgi:hypothetical protein
VKLRKMHDFLSDGKRLVVLASSAIRDTVHWANQLTQSYGIQIEDSEYDEVECRDKCIINDNDTVGINRVWFFRPSPIRVSKNARLLVTNPQRESEGFVARSGPTNNLYVVGQSIVEGLLFPVWPFDNARVLANIICERA